MLDKIGTGTYATVYRCRRRSTGAMYAVKVFESSHYLPKQMAALRKEAEIMAKVRRMMDRGGGGSPARVSRPHHRDPALCDALCQCGCVVPSGRESTPGCVLFRAHLRVSFCVRVVMRARVSVHPRARAACERRAFRCVDVQVEHPSVVKITDYFEEPRRKTYLVMELATGGELFARIVDQARTHRPPL
jgi:serine/threonine protein kinase